MPRFGATDLLRLYVRRRMFVWLMLVLLLQILQLTEVSIPHAV